MAKLALFVALVALLAHSCGAQVPQCLDTYAKCCRALGKPTKFQSKLVDLEGKKIGTVAFCFTGTKSAPTSGYTRTRINGRGRKIRSGLRVDIGYIGTLAASELTLAQAGNFTPVGVPPVFTPPLQEAPSKTILGVSNANTQTLAQAGCNKQLGNQATIGLAKAAVTLETKLSGKGCDSP